MSVLAELVAPLAIEDFKTSYAYRRAVHLTGQADRFARLDLAIKPEDILSSKLLAGHPVKLSGGGRSVTTKDQDEIRSELGRGATLILEDADRFSAPLGRFIDKISGEICAPCRFNLYRSAPGRQGYRTHYDTHDFFILQLQGSKRWRVFPHTVEWPLFYQKAHGTSPPPEDSIYLECTLSPGDVLYVPKGHWHDAAAVDLNESSEMSTHLTLAMFLRTGIDFLTWLVDELREDVRARETFPFVWATGGIVPDELLNDFTRHSKALLHHVHGCLADDAFDAIRFLTASLQSIRSHVPVPLDAADPSRLNVKDLEEHVVMIERTERPALLFTSADVVEVHLANQIIDLGHRATPLLQTILGASKPLTFSDLTKSADGLTRQQTVEVLHSLVQHGVVRIIRRPE